ncbi:hypothetical protein ACQKWADRAFT_204564 [Trichoderma austrokoningii]
MLHVSGLLFVYFIYCFFPWTGQCVLFTYLCKLGLGTCRPAGTIRHQCTLCPEQAASCFCCVGLCLVCSFLFFFLLFFGQIHIAISFSASLVGATRLVSRTDSPRFTAAARAKGATSSAILCSMRSSTYSPSPPFPSL